MIPYINLKASTQLKVFTSVDLEFKSLVFSSPWVSGFLHYESKL